MSYEPDWDVIDGIGDLLEGREYEYNGVLYQSGVRVTIQAFTTYLQSHPEELQRFCDAVLERISATGMGYEKGAMVANVSFPLYRIPNSGGQS